MVLDVDEMHHLPALAETDPDAAAHLEQGADDPVNAWSWALLPLLESATVRLLLSGTLEWADGKGILWLPYRKGQGMQAGASWRDEAGLEVDPYRLGCSHPGETTRPAFHRLAHRLCRDAAARSIRRHPRPARPAPTGPWL